MSKPMVTSTGRVRLDPVVSKVLDAYGEVFGELVREIWVRCFDPRSAKPESLAAIESDLCGRGWTRRQVRSAGMRAKAAQDAATESRELEIVTLMDQLEETEERLMVARAARNRRRKKGCAHKTVLRESAKCHGLGRKFDRLTVRLHDAVTTPAVPLWGSRKLFHAQHDLEANGIADHGAWLEQWRAARSNTIVLVGDRDKPGGNTDARIVLTDTGAVISLALPAQLRHLADGAARIEIPVVGFQHHRNHIIAAQELDHERHLEQVRRFEAKEPSALGRKPSMTRPVPAGRGPVTVSFTRQPDGRWHAAATVERHGIPARITRRGRNTAGQRVGALGVDINPDHLAWAIITADGNPIRWGRIDLDLAAPDGTPAKAGRVESVIGDAIAELVQVAVDAGRIPIVSEDLDFARSRNQQRHLPRGLRRLLNGFAYRAILTTLAGRCAEHGVEHLSVNPAWTSVLGQTNYAATYGVSVDQAAACVIARRGLGFKNLVRPTVVPPTGPEDPATGSTARKRARNTGIKTLAKRLPRRRSTWSTDWLTRQGCRPDPATTPATAPTSVTPQPVTPTGHRAPQRQAARPQLVPSTRSQPGHPQPAVANNGQQRY